MAYQRLRYQGYNPVWFIVVALFGLLLVVAGQNASLAPLTFHVGSFTEADVGKGLIVLSVIFFFFNRVQVMTERHRDKKASRQRRKVISQRRMENPEDGLRYHSGTQTRQQKPRK